MKLDGYGFEKTELMSIIEEIYDLKSKQQDLKLSLNSEEFHYQYIGKRKGLVEHEVIFRLLFIIPITIFVVMILCTFGYYMLYPDEIDGLTLLVGLLIITFLGYASVRLWIREIKMLTLLRRSRNSDYAIKYANNKEIHTFESDEILSREKIEMLKEQIQNIEGQIAELEEQQSLIMQQKERTEDFLRKQGVLFDEDPNKIKQEQGKFSLREESIALGDTRELFEFYSKEEQYLHKHQSELQVKLTKINKDISAIDDNFEGVVKMMVLFFMGYVLLILIQGGFADSSVMNAITSVICIFVSVGMIVYLEGKCKMPVIFYLVEHDNKYIQEYAFCHNMRPMRYARQEIVESMEKLEQELKVIKEKKRLLES